jgi:hypothetical protein
MWMKRAKNGRFLPRKARRKNPRKQRAPKVRRRKNPLPSQHVIYAQRNREPVLKYIGGIKFSRSGRAVRFADAGSAASMAAALKRSFAGPLKGYRVWST